MLTIESLLARYQPEPLALPRCPVYAELIKPTKSFTYTGHGVSASVDLVSEEYRELPRGKKKPAGFAFILYTDDLYLLDQGAPGPKMLGPLAQLTSNAFTWHALRLTAAAYLSGKAVLRLHLQQLSAGNQVHHPRYNPHLIAALFADYRQQASPVVAVPAQVLPGVGEPLSTQNQLFV
jgi:hypothetical protein